MEVSLVETHVSVIFFVGDHAYKLKKPVHFEFVDLSDRRARERLCHREVELNRRLAPDVYEGVADVMGPDGEPCDHLVVMKRMPAERGLAALVEAGDPRCVAALDDVAEVLAAFHAGAERGPDIDACATRDAVDGLWRANAAQLRPFGGSVLPRDELDRVNSLAETFLRGRAALFDQRIEEGCICDGHGDLMADDLYVLDDGPRILDCLEFSDRLRYGDIAADLAFLVMDLERLGATELADHLVTAYEQASGARIPRALLHLYVAYRAQVRAMVACLRAAQEGAPPDVADDAGARARALLHQCVVHLERATVGLVLVGGLPGTGKTTVAQGLGQCLEAPVLRSDVIRKELAGLEPGEHAPAPFGSGIYSGPHTERTYAELLARARRHLALGETVVVDASFGSDRHREAARQLADEVDATVVELRCDLAAGEAAQRMLRRAAGGSDASDADAGVARHLAAVADPWPQSAPVSTVGSEREVVSRALGIVEGLGRSRGAGGSSAAERAGGPDI